MQQQQLEPAAGDIVPPDVDEADEDVSTGSSHSANFVDDDGDYNSPTPPPADVKPKKQRRVRVASCQRCRQAKEKCSRTQPCSSCHIRGEECIWLDGVPHTNGDSSQQAPKQIPKREDNGTTAPSVFNLDPQTVAANHHADHSSAHGPSAASRQVKKRNRRITSCEKCRTQKLKCSRTMPCTSCSMRNEQCVWLDGVPHTAGPQPVPMSAQAEIGQLRQQVAMLTALLAAKERGEEHTPALEGVAALLSLSSSSASLLSGIPITSQPVSGERIKISHATSAVSKVVTNGGARNGIRRARGVRAHPSVFQPSPPHTLPSTTGYSTQFPSDSPTRLPLPTGLQPPVKTGLSTTIAPIPPFKPKSNPPSTLSLPTLSATSSLPPSLASVLVKPTSPHSNNLTSLAGVVIPPYSKSPLKSPPGNLTTASSIRSEGSHHSHPLSSSSPLQPGAGGAEGVGSSWALPPPRLGQQARFSPYPSSSAGVALASNGGGGGLASKSRGGVSGARFQEVPKVIASGMTIGVVEDGRVGAGMVVDV